MITRSSSACRPISRVLSRVCRLHCCNSREAHLRTWPRNFPGRYRLELGPAESRVRKAEGSSPDESQPKRVCLPGEGAVPSAAADQLKKLQSFQQRNKVGACPLALWALLPATLQACSSSEARWTNLRGPYRKQTGSQHVCAAVKATRLRLHLYCRNFCSGCTSRRRRILRSDGS